MGYALQDLPSPLFRSRCSLASLLCNHNSKYTNYVLLMRRAVKWLEGICKRLLADSKRRQYMLFTNMAYRGLRHWRAPGLPREISFLVACSRLTVRDEGDERGLGGKRGGSPRHPSIPFYHRLNGQEIGTSYIVWMNQLLLQHVSIATPRRIDYVV